MTDPDRAQGPGDDGDEEFEPTGKWANPAIYASNWRSILIIDSMLGFAVFWVGLLMILFWNWFVGSFVGALGLTYMAAVGRRYLQWRWLRRRAGLDS
ncbi:MAG: hypothetical protein U5K29_06455 [Acidimicrobiales bacterium]|nr:hypothetical protein [Acidimicrobiales bacterium]